MTRKQILCRYLKDLNKELSSLFSLSGDTIFLSPPEWTAEVNLVLQEMHSYETELATLV